MSVLTSPYLVTAESAPWLNFLGEDATVLVGGEQTDGTYTLIRFRLEDGYGPPLHVHHAEDELFYLLSGSMYAECGDHKVTVEPGGCLLLPSGAPDLDRLNEICARYHIDILGPPLRL